MRYATAGALTELTISAISAHLPDVDGLTHEYLGEGGIAYNWVAGNPGTYTTSVTSTFGAGFTITASFDANEVVVPVESGTWGSIKALYR